MKYTLIAIINKDRREIEYEDAWAVFTASHDLLLKGIGYPVGIKYGGYTIATETELNDFDRRLNRALKLGTKHILNLRKYNLKQIRERVVPK